MNHIINNLYIGDYLDSQNIYKLKEHKIQYIVNCAAELKNPFIGTFWYLNVPINDPDLRILKYANMIKTQLNAAFGKPTLLHCVQGISRSVTVASIFLSWKLQKPWEEIVSLIRTKRPQASPNPIFKDCLEVLSNEGKI